MSLTCKDCFLMNTPNSKCCRPAIHAILSETIRKYNVTSLLKVRLRSMKEKTMYQVIQAK